MNRNVTKYVLVAWQDSDVADHVKDKSFVGKLAARKGEKENQLGKDGEKNVGGSLVKKKRISKKLSIAGGVGDSSAHGNAELMAALGLKSDSLESAKSSSNNRDDEFTELSNHFAFGNQTSAADGLVSNKTSNNKLDGSLRITYAEMVRTLKSYKTPMCSEIAKLNKHFEQDYFPEWFRLMKFGFNILVDGVGSKQDLIRLFCRTYLKDAYYVEMLGYHHDFNHKNILKNILSDVLGLQTVYKTMEEQINALSENLKHDLYFIIHNIDGNNLRDKNMQNMLGSIASNKFVHIIASVDHINSSLLWDNAEYLSFKWVHFEANTLKEYTDEIMFENSLMLNQSTNVQLSSIIHILKSLTQNAKNIFLIMVQAVLDKDNVKKNMTFTKLYHECREKFYVSNELTLRAQLTEFIDHKLIKLKTESDGYETIYLLIDEKNLKIYLEDLQDQV